MARLTVAQWAMCRHDYEVHGNSFSELGTKYDIDRSNISRKAKAEGWKALASDDGETPGPGRTKKPRESAFETSRANAGAKDKTHQTHQTQQTHQTHQTQQTQQQNAHVKIDETIGSSRLDRGHSHNFGADITRDVSTLNNAPESFGDDDFEYMSDAQLTGALASIDSELSILASAFGSSGRLTKYHPAFSRIAYQAAMLGLTQKELSDLLGVAESTIGEWLRTRKEFSIAWRGGAKFADMQVARSLFKLATGFSVTVPDIRMVAGEALDVEKTVFIEPNFHAQRFWLINRQPEIWKDKVEVQQQITAAVIDKEAMAERYERVLSKAAELGGSFTERGKRLGLTLDDDVD